MKFQVQNKIMMLALEIGIITALIADWLLIKPVEIFILLLVTLKRKIGDLSPVVRKRALKKMYSEKMSQMV